METDPLAPYSQLAREHGIDPTDEAALIRFLRTDLQQKDAITRKQSFRQVLDATVGRGKLEEDHLEAGGGAGAWLPYLLKVADGVVNLNPWDGSISRYMHEEIWRYVDQIDRLEVNQQKALDTMFSAIRPENEGGASRALRIVPWTVEHKTNDVVAAFIRFFWYCVLEHSREPNASEKSIVSKLSDSLLDHLRFIEPLLKQCERSPQLSQKRRLYDDMMNVLRRMPRITRVSHNALRELVVLEREVSSRARFACQLVNNGKWVATATDLENRMEFGDFYEVIRLTMYLTADDEATHDEYTLEVLEWLTEFIDRPEVHSHDAEVADFESDLGLPIRNSWMRLQERILSEQSIYNALATV